MIIGAGAIDTETNMQVLRTSKSLPMSRTNQYIAEFTDEATDREGIVEKESYKYIYTSSGPFKIFIQASKDASYEASLAILKYIAANADGDVYDILVVLDNLLYGAELYKVDLAAARTMDSQEEKIHNMMAANRQMEMRRKEKERRVAAYNAQVGLEPTPAAAVAVALKPKPVVEKSDKPVLVMIKERLRIVTDKENNIKENSLNGEISMFIGSKDYHNSQLKMKNLKGALKFSPYLDKKLLKKGILKFEKERGINKVIPLLKWTGKAVETPILLDMWADEDDGKYLSIVEVTAKMDLTGLSLNFSKENLSEIDTGDAVINERDGLVWRIGDMSKGDTRTCEVKYVSYDTAGGLFPATVQFTRADVENPVDVEDLLVDGVSLPDFEVRKLTETESYEIRDN